MAGGGSLDKFSLKRLLTNPVYLGEVHFQGQIYQAEQEAIVDRETWDRVQELLAPSPDRPRCRSSKSPSILAGILRCGPCDSAMTPTYSQKGKVRYRYYLCLKAHRRGWDSCPSKSVPAREIEKFVVDRIRAIGRDPDLVARTAAEAGQQLAARKTELAVEEHRILKDLEQAHAGLRSQIASIPGNGKPRRRGQAAATEQSIRDLEARLAAVQEEHAGLKSLTIDPDDLRRALAAFDPVWEQLTSAEQVRIVQLLIERIDYDGGTGQLDITFRPAGVRTFVENGTSPEGVGP
jgi:site-specific DNA recombinase